MLASKFIIIDSFIIERENKVIENYQIVVSDDSLYLFKSSQNYGKYIKSIFSGVGDIIGLFGDTVGIIGELASEITGSKFSNMLKEYSEKSSEKNIKKLIKNLDTISAKKKGITKVEFRNITKITIKKGYVVNGMSSVEFGQNNEKLKLKSKSRSKINELVAAINASNNTIEIKTKYV